MAIKTDEKEALTPAQILGSAGGRARALNLTKAQRKASALKAIKARWKGHRKNKSK